MEKILSSPNLIVTKIKNIKGEALYISSECLKGEVQYSEILEGRSKNFNHVVEPSEKENNFLTNNQKQAINYALSSADISIIEGIPGSGKTTIMKEIAKIYKKDGYEVLGAAQSAIASHHLKKLANIDTKTVAKWKYDLSRQNIALPQKSLFILDEASMIDLNSMSFLLEGFKDSKIILVGDSNQFGAIGVRGALTKAIEICGSYKLMETKRHKNPLHRKANICLSKYKLEEAIDLYAKTNSFVISESKSKEILANDFVKDFLQKKDVVALAYSNKSVVEINKLIRDHLKNIGILKNGKEIKFGDKSFNLAENEKIVFCKNDREIGILNGEVGRIKTIDGKSILVQIENREIEFDLRNYADIKYGYALTSHKSQGSTYEVVKILYEPYLRFEAFNVMMTRHREDVKFYADRGSLMENISSIEAKFRFRSDDLEFLKDRLMNKAGQKESNLLGMDYLNQGMAEEVLKYIEIRNYLNDHLSNYQINSILEKDEAKEYLRKFSEKEVLAKEFKDHFSIFKEHLAASRIPITELSQEKKLTPHKSLESVIRNGEGIESWLKYQKTIKEEACKIESNLVLKRERKDAIIERTKQIDWLKEFTKEGVFCHYRAPKKAVNQLKEFKKDEDKLELYDHLSENPKELGRLKGLNILGFENRKRLKAVENLSRYFKAKYTIEKLEREQKNTSLREISKEIAQDQNRLKELSKNIAVKSDYEFAFKLEQNREKDLPSKTASAPVRPSSNREFVFQESKKQFIRFSDVNLSNSNIENIFNQYHKYFNSEDKVLKRKNEICCGSLSMNLNTGLWMRFSTKEGGNIYDFVMAATGCSKREALEIIAEDTHQNIPSSNRKFIITPSKPENNQIWFPAKIPTGIKIDRGSIMA